MQKIYFSFLGIIISAAVIAQPVLKPSIGLSALPADSTSICNIVCSGNYSQNGFANTGLQVGDTIPQFQFYTLNGTPYDAQSLLNTGKSLCIIAGSYTCPVWRGKIADINTLMATYGAQVNFLVVYVVEAHPMSPDISPYSCNVWNPSQNQTDGVMYLQPTTYGQRKATAQDMINNTCSCITPFTAPMVIDGSCNEFWTTFGPAPNNAYLINPLDGTVYCKHGWFNQAPNNMSSCISSLLSVLAVNEENNPENISLYPNPSADGNFFISGLTSGSELSIYNVLGEKIFSEKINPDEISFSVNRPAGIYSYQLTDKNGNCSSGKIIIE